MTGGPSQLLLKNNIGNSIGEGILLANNFILISASIKTWQNTNIWAINNMNGSWIGNLCMFGKEGDKIVLYFSNFSIQNGPQQLSDAIQLSSDEQFHILPGINYIGDETVIIDSYLFQNDSQGMINNWYIVSENNISQLIPSSNNQLQPSGQAGFGRVSQGTLNNQGNPSFLEVFLMENGLPQQYPLDTISNQTIQNLQMTDFSVSYDGMIFILNYTNIAYIFQLDEAINKFIMMKQNIILDEQYKYLGIQCSIQQDQVNNILIVSDEQIIEFVSLMNSEPQIIGYYNLPFYINYTGMPPELDINPQNIIIQQNQLVYLFERMKPIKTNIGIQYFIQKNYIASQQSYFAALNELPQQILSINQTKLHLQNIQKAQIFGYLNTIQLNGTINLQAISYNHNTIMQTCNSSIYYEIINSTNTSILQTIYKINTDPQMINIYPDKLILYISQYLSGPAIQSVGYTKLVSFYNQSDENQIKNYSSTSKIISTTYQNLELSIHQLQKKKKIYFVQNVYNPIDNSLIQFIQEASDFSAYICYKGQYLLYKECHLIHTMKLGYLVQKVEVIFPINQEVYAFFFFNMSSGYLYSNSVLYPVIIDWDYSQLTGSFTRMNTLLLLQQNKTGLIIQDFTTIGQQLIITVGQINQIQVYQIQIDNNYNYQLKNILNINNSSLNITYEQFQPIQVVGNNAYYGSILFINNQNGFIIVSIINNNIITLNQTYIINYGQSQLLQISNYYLIVVLYDETSNFQNIQTFSLIDPYNPTFIKNLPLYDANFSYPLQIHSDDFFVYILVNNSNQSFLNIYKPNLTYHDSLYQQLDIGYENNSQVYITSTNDYEYSYLTIVDSNGYKNIQILQNIEIAFIPGLYGGQYLTQVNISLIFYNQFNQSQINYSSIINIINTQLRISQSIDENQGAIQNFYINKGVKTYTLNTSQFQGTIVEYQIYCQLLCNDRNITLKNILSQQNEDIKFKDESILVNAMMNSPNSSNQTLIQTNSQILIVYQNLSVEQYVQFQTTYQQCNAIGSTQNIIVSACIQNIQQDGYITIITTTGQNQSQETKIYGLIQVYKIQILGNLIFLMGQENNYDENIIINIYDYTQINDQIEINNTNMYSFNCFNNNQQQNIIDFSITNLTNFIDEGQQYFLSLMIYTCNKSQELSYVAILQDHDGKITLGSLQNFSMTKQFDITLLSLQYYCQVLPFSYDENGQISLFLTTSNLSNFIVNITFNIQDINSINFDPTYQSSRLIATVPQYGVWDQQNYLSYLNGLLVLSYSYRKQQAVLVIYNLSDINISEYQSDPILIKGGIYTQYADNLLYQLQINDSINYLLISTSTYNNNLSNLLISDSVTIQLNIDQEFQTQTILIKANNSYYQYQIDSLLIWQDNIQLKNQIRWWGWLLIVLGIIGFLAICSYFYAGYQRRQLDLEQKQKFNIEQQLIQINN